MAICFACASGDWSLPRAESNALPGRASVVRIGPTNVPEMRGCARRQQKARAGARPGCHRSEQNWLAVDEPAIRPAHGSRKRLKERANTEIKKGKDP